MDKKLTKDYKLKDFTKSKWADLSPQQHLMLISIAKVVQKIKGYLKVPVRVSQGVMTIKDYHRHISYGYHPKEVSDHFFGAPVLLRTPKLKKLFGNRYTYSVGAADLVPDEGDVWEAYKEIIRGCRTGKLKINTGQITYGKKGLREWIHVSNPHTLIYSKTFVNTYLNRPKFRKSLDGGRTFQVIRALGQ